MILETVAYIATTEAVTCRITIEIVMCVMHCRKYHLHNGNRDSNSIISIKIVIHIFAAETSNCIIATETVTCAIATKRSTNITVAESNTDIIAIEPQNLHTCNRRCHLHNYHRKSQLYSSNRNCQLKLRTEIDNKNFHLQKWCQSEILLVTINEFSEWVRTKFKAK